MLVHRSNSLEELARQLAERFRVRRSASAVLAPEAILIQSPGIQRYLTRQLAGELGIVAGVTFPYPRAFFETLFERAFSDAPEAARWKRETLAFVLFRLFGEVRGGLRSSTLDLSLPGWERILAVLERDPDGRERFLLAERYAQLFDQYITYRPKLVLGWAAGDGAEDEQAELFRALVRELGPHHFAARAARLLREVDGERLREIAPGRVHLVGGPGLPPIFLSLLRRLSEATDVAVFSFSVCREYFGDAHPLEGEELTETGDGIHPLLASLGQVGAHYQSLLELTGGYVDGASAFLVPEETSVLTALQRDLLEGRVRPGSEKLDARYRRCSSLSLDVAHSPLREVEILREKLLGFFADDPTLRPEDVVVLTPDVTAYAPLVRAVFGDAHDAPEYLPFRIADQSERIENPLATVFFRALALLSGRFPASEFLDVLAARPVAEHLDLSAEDVERVAELLAGAQFYWGIDANHRASFGLLPEPEGTFESGLDRLFLGMAMADDGESLFAGLAPFDGVLPGDRAAILGISRLFAELRRARVAFGFGREGGPEGPIDALVRDLRGLATGLFGGEGVDAIALFDTLSALEGRAAEAGVVEPVPLVVVTRLLEKSLVERKQSTDFLSGGVTFCELLPLRTVPFRIACVLGLGQSDFPRSDFDALESKILERPQLGDRSLRAEDKYLFLELLVATKEKLSLSFVGRSVQDNAEKPPSVLVTELTAAVEALFAESSEEPFLEGRLHPLQPFSPRAFVADGPHPPNFRTRFFDGARALGARADQESPFLDREVTLPKEPSGGLVLEEVVRFFQRPARAWLRRLSLAIDDAVTILEDREDGTLGGLGSYAVGEFFLGRLRRGKPAAREVARARGALPLGVVGAIAAEELCDSAVRVCERLAVDDALVEGSFENLLWRRPGGGLVRARLRLPRGGTRFLITMGGQNDRRRLAAWIEHLFLSVTCPGRYATVLLSGKGDELEERSFAPLPKEHAERIFEDILGAFERLEVHPEPFTPDVLFAIARAASKPKADLGVEVSKILGSVDARSRSRVEGVVRDHDFEQFFGRNDPYRLRDYRPDTILEHPVVALARVVAFPALAVETSEVER